MKFDPDKKDQFAVAIHYERIMNLSQMKLFGKSVDELKGIGAHLQGMAYLHLGMNTASEDMVKGWNQCFGEPLFPERELLPGLRIYGTTALFGQIEDWDLILYKPDPNAFYLDGISSEIHFKTEVWYPVERTFGPITLKKIGIEGMDFQFAFKTDGLLSLFGVELDLNDLQVTVPFIQPLPPDDSDIKTF